MRMKKGKLEQRILGGGGGSNDLATNKKGSGEKGRKINH